MLPLLLGLYVNHVAFEFTGEFEGGDGSFGNGNLFVGLGIATYAGFAGFQFEGAKATDLDVISLSQAVFDGLQKGVNYYSYVFADDSGVFRNDLY